MYVPTIPYISPSLHLRKHMSSSLDIDLGVIRIISQPPLNADIKALHFVMNIYDYSLLILTLYDPCHKVTGDNSYGGGNERKQRGHICFP